MVLFDLGLSFFFGELTILFLYNVTKDKSHKEKDTLFHERDN